MSRRSRAREIALQLLYRDDLNEDHGNAPDDEFMRSRLSGDPGLIQLAQSLLRGVRNHRETIDNRLKLASENWNLERMAATDRNILRLGAFEMMFTDTPPKVAVNEAIEMAKRYGDQDSPRFVNGILDRLLKQTKADGDPEKQAESP